MGLEIPTLVIGAEVSGKVPAHPFPDPRGPASGHTGEERGEILRIFPDAVVVATEDGRRLYVPSTEFDRWEVVSRPRITEPGSGYL